jgi:hypothetical protein
VSTAVAASFLLGKKMIFSFFEPVAQAGLEFWVQVIFPPTPYD